MSDQPHEGETKIGQSGTTGYFSTPEAIRARDKLIRDLLLSATARRVAGDT